MPRAALIVAPRGLDHHSSGGAEGQGSAQQRIEALLVVPLRPRAHQPLDLAAILEGETAQGELTISEVTRRSGVRATTIRYYESINVLPVPRRANGRRRYDAAILDRLAFIQVTQRLGFTLTEIVLLLE